MGSGGEDGDGSGHERDCFGHLGSETVVTPFCHSILNARLSPISSEHWREANVAPGVARNLKALK